ncbi:hypothetical protein BDF14DRAFT_1858878 [Spinellus fusiger]|nr:hypothetical protein BDF14DRAFT_1858878 [Spinellus fusiger]
MLLPLFTKLTLQPSNAVSVRTYMNVRSLHPKRFTSIFSEVPVRPRSAWQLYCREVLNQETNEPKQKIADAMKNTIAPKWNMLTDAERQVYHTRFAEESKKHDFLFEEALANATSQQIYDENLLRKKYKLETIRDPQLPKRPTNAYLIFFAQWLGNNKERLKGVRMPDQTKEAAEVYKKMTIEEKQKYLDIANQNNKDYLKAITQFSSTIVPFKAVRPKAVRGPRPTKYLPENKYKKPKSGVVSVNTKATKPTKSAKTA